MVELRSIGDNSCSTYVFSSIEGKCGDQDAKSWSMKLGSSMDEWIGSVYWYLLDI